MNDLEKVKELERIVLLTAEEKRDAINAEVDAKIEERLSVSRTSASREAAKIKDLAVSDAQKEARLIVSSAQNKSQAELMSLRAEIIDETFAHLTEKLIKFTESQEYDAFFEKKLSDALNAAGKYIGESDARVFVIVTEHDYNAHHEKIADEAERMVVWGRPVVTVSKEDIIGGCIVNIPRMGILIDNSLLAEVEREHGNFLSWSGLSVQ